MPTVSIFHNEKLIDSHDFNNQFMIIEEGGNLRWLADNQLADQMHGEIRIWIRFNVENKHHISFVRPEWRLTIDTVEYEPGFYQDIAIGTRTVELRYQNFRFVCS